MTSKLIFVSAAIALMGAPAVAQPGSSTPKSERNAAAETTKYCLSYDDTTGSRISKQECKTKRQWSDEGIDIEKMLKK